MLDIQTASCPPLIVHYVRLAFLSRLSAFPRRCSWPFSLSVLAGLLSLARNIALSPDRPARLIGPSAIQSASARSGCFTRRRLRAPVAFFHTTNQNPLDLPCAGRSPRFGFVGITHSYRRGGGSCYSEKPTLGPPPLRSPGGLVLLLSPLLSSSPSTFYPLPLIRSRSPRARRSASARSGGAAAP